MVRRIYNFCDTTAFALFLTYWRYFHPKYTGLQKFVNLTITDVDSSIYVTEKSENSIANHVNRIENANFIISHSQNIKKFQTYFRIDTKI